MEIGKELSKEELIDQINELKKVLNSEKYGLYFDRKAAPEEIVLKCSKEIPVLVHDKSKDLVRKGIDNILIEGDNFAVLSALSTIYPNGFVDVIYIDPPYNTGNNDFAYNDKFVDGEDGYRHTKWLNFMEARLTLAKTLLKDNGIIYISIDEHEFAQLKLLCDEIFGEKNFIENFIWIKNSTKNLSKTTSTNHEYVLCYAKNKGLVEDLQLFRVPKPGLDEVQTILDKAHDDGLSINKTESMLKSFYKQRNDLKGISMYDMVDISVDPNTKEKKYRVFTLDNLAAPKATGKAEMYDVIHPLTKKPCKCPVTGWRLKKSVMDERIRNGLIYFYDDESRVPRFKRFLDTVPTDVLKSIIEDYEDGKKELMRIFGGDAPFSNAKPTTLLKKIFAITKKDAVIMDFFAGSGTTAQAVLELNKEDGGNRRFILCTNNESNIMTDVCYPRIKTVLTGIRPDGSKYSDGLKGNLRYFKVDFVQDHPLKDQAKYTLVEQCDGLLCILEDCYDKYDQGSKYNIYVNSTKDKCISIFNDNYDEKVFNEMLDKVIKTSFKDNVIYYFSLDNNVDPNLEKKVKEKIPAAVVKPIPSKIYEIYKKIADDIRRTY